jgi:hypothetical protein
MSLITQVYLQKFLPALSDPSLPVNKFLNSIQAPASLSNLFPAYQGGDISGSQLANAIFKVYGDAIFKGLSWHRNLKYTSQNELDEQQAVSSQQQLSQVQPQGYNQQFQLGNPSGGSPRGAFEVRRCTTRFSRSKANTKEGNGRLQSLIGVSAVHRFVKPCGYAGPRPADLGV